MSYIDAKGNSSEYKYIRGQRPIPQLHRWIVSRMIYIGGSFSFCQKLGIHIASNPNFHPALRGYVAEFFISICCYSYTVFRTITFRRGIANYFSRDG